MTSTSAPTGRRSPTWTTTAITTCPTAPPGEFGAPNNIFRNDGQGFFSDATPASMAARAEGTRGLVTFDMDRDGDLDIFSVSGFLGDDDPGGERNELYRNDGNFQFTAITSGAAHDALAGQGVTDTDYDGDGDIDLIAGNRTGRLVVLRNDGGTFTQVTAAALGIDRDAASGVTMADIDTDGDQDMLLVDLDASDERVGHLFRNNGGTFTRIQDFTSIEGFMGGFADLDNDQDLDLVFAGDDVSLSERRRRHLHPGTGGTRRRHQRPAGDRLRRHRRRRRPRLRDRRQAKQQLAGA